MPEKTFVDLIEDRCFNRATARTTQLQEAALLALRDVARRTTGWQNNHTAGLGRLAGENLGGEVFEKVRDVFLQQERAAAAKTIIRQIEAGEEDQCQASDSSQSS